MLMARIFGILLSNGSKKLVSVVLHSVRFPINHVGLPYKNNGKLLFFNRNCTSSLIPSA